MSDSYSTRPLQRLFMLATLLFAMSGSPVVHAESVTLNLKGADIAALIGTVAEITGKNFIVDPRVKGKITIVSSRPLDKKEVYEVFLSILEVHGFSAIQQGKVIKIMPDADAKHHPAPNVTDEHPGVGDEMVTRVIEVKNVAAAQLVPILRPLVPPQGHMAAYPQSNMLIISDRAANIERLMEIIGRIDQPTSGDVEFVKLNYAAASEVVRVLTTLAQQSKKGDPQAPSAMTVADERTNSILIGGDKGDRLQLRAIIAHLDTPTETIGDTHVVYLRYAKAKDLVPVLTGVQTTQAKAAKGGAAVPGAPPGVVPGGVGGTGGAGSDIFNIQADESSNALVITAPPGVFRSLEGVIRQLDVRRAQVMVEAIIAEVSSDISAQLGVEWAAIDRRGTSPAAVTNFSPSGGGVVQGIGTALSGGTTLPSIGLGMTLGLGRVSDNGLSFAAILRALKSDTANNVLSTPNLVTLDNEEANIFVGDEVSIPSGSFTSTGTTGGTAQPSNPFTTFNRTKVGIDLKVKPQISEGDTIKLEIEQKVNGITTGTPGEANLKTNERSIKTVVMVDNGKILVLGGLIKEEQEESNSRVPLLGDIPLIGALFRSKSTSKRKTNLMVFLRPVVMRDAESGSRLTQTRYDYIRAKQLLLREKSSSMFSSDQSPLMPEMKDYLGAPSPAPAPAPAPAEMKDAPAPAAP